MAANAKTDPNIRLTAELLEAARDMRASARMSQAVVARGLNLTVGYVSQLERGAACGPVAASQ